MDVKLLVCKFIWDDGMGSVSDALECLRLCKEAGATISSNSWGGVPNSREWPGRECTGWCGWGMSKGSLYCNAHSWLHSCSSLQTSGGHARARATFAQCLLPSCPLACLPINLPTLPTPCPSAGLIEEALKQVQEAGMLFVVASGNHGVDLDARPAFPASSRWVASGAFEHGLPPACCCLHVAASAQLCAAGLPPAPAAPVQPSSMSTSSLPPALAL